MKINFLIVSVSLFVLLTILPGATFSQTIENDPQSENDIEENISERIRLDDKPQKKRTSHSPTRAAIMSAILPGAGQAYNRKYWKIPIIYAGFGGLGYAIYFNTKEHNIYRDAIKIRLDGNPDTIDEFEGVYTTDNLFTLKNYYRRNMDLAIIGTILFYTLNIIDATVDAHLFEFDVSDDLSFRLFPPNNYQYEGITAFQSRINQPIEIGMRWKISK